ncbi:zinc metalloprotease HtpX [Halostagnicola kamekurae]|uniref:Protease HtpX homolog n=1 Tax=Halostagnicola kamekurae TaxID=619731 RepID=A0A1I6PCZ8_9EURY|nr:zinc metalloprotease HtpX [Halostagnicola kamekurae]SFS38051.1 Heat shock protein. Metallo peptidase. MEROPS family M48B [Halostagnicola kamekurae]
MDWQPDWGLRARMGLTMFLLFAVYLFFIAGLTTVFGGGASSLLLVALLFGSFSLIQFFYSDKLALWSMGASEVEREEYPQLHAAVDRLSQQADLPKPKVAVVDSKVPNAFATGRSPSNAVVAVTTGLMNTLDQEELDGVLAHELAHVKNRDVAVMTIASFLSTIAFLIVRFGGQMMLFTGGGRGHGDDARGAAGLLVAILISLLVWIVSYLLIRALSRYREFAADRGAAAITGNPGALASALMKISGEVDKVPDEDLREEAEMNAFFIIPLKSGIVGRLFSTHPSTERRIEQLRDLERETATA